MGLTDTPNPSSSQRSCERGRRRMACVVDQCCRRSCPQLVLLLIGRIRKANERILQIGQVMYSSVFGARVLETGRILAFKKARFDNSEADSARKSNIAEKRSRNERDLGADGQKGFVNLESL
ncbi:hypothetical protein Bca4012_009842 [Brassica carinata]|uniref:Uncharacterized protein n=1 Tax=Brassica carinata TaxID=52824 RepID=A0A8X7V1D5_BRACI|nr:hypothetical protein Bca52824_035064 [Brassica carinata]